MKNLLMSKGISRNTIEKLSEQHLKEKNEMSEKDYLINGINEALKETEDLELLHLVYSMLMQ